MKDMYTQIDERLERLEIKIAHMEDFLDRMQSVVIDQSKQIEKLNQEHRVLKDKILFLTKELEEIPNRKPPHY